MCFLHKDAPLSIADKIRSGREETMALLLHIFLTWYGVLRDSLGWSQNLDGLLPKPLNRFELPVKVRSQILHSSIVDLQPQLGKLNREVKGFFKMVNRVSASLNAKDRTEVLAAMTTIKEKLPFLLSLTTEERKGLPKMGDRNLPFVKKALEVATHNPDFLPRSFEIEELRKDVELFESLYPLVVAFTQLNELLNDTHTVVGSEAYAAALQVYNYAKLSGNSAGMEAVVDELGQRFSRKAKKAAIPVA